MTTITATVDFDQQGKQIGWLRLPHSVTRSAYGTLPIPIAVIQNGMNLTGVESYTQKVVLGFVILIAVLLDMLKKRSWGKKRAAVSA